MRAFKKSDSFNSTKGPGDGLGGDGPHGPGYGGGGSNSGFQGHQGNKVVIIKVIRVVIISNPARGVSSSSNPDIRVIQSS